MHGKGAHIHICYIFHGLCTGILQGMHLLSLSVRLPEQGTGKSYTEEACLYTKPGTLLSHMPWYGSKGRDHSHH